ncbi:hypothetical protein BGZ95_008637 [Linnemannia exigua]|uniref:Uncharacterized protein n=1 Tax=Linnemannia exigua TaxID=604196 RepID=A0AAD4DFL1_9FUNG|nr:hypothetical protein BGZ95_008637 [Linnemannia exigua]
MSSTTVTAALTIADQDIFAITSAEWETPQSSRACESIHRMSARTPEPIDTISSPTSDAETQEQQQQQSELTADADAEHNISQDRQFQKFLRRFGGNHKSRK